jgi:hypothetical protein
VREVLYREMYRGQMVWNATRKRDTWGRKHQSSRPSSDWIRVPAPELAIVADAEWAAAHARLEAVRGVYLTRMEGRPFGRRALGDPSKSEAPAAGDVASAGFTHRSIVRPLAAFCRSSSAPNDSSAIMTFSLGESIVHSLSSR